jgi:hypothetical protein
MLSTPHRRVSLHSAVTFPPFPAAWAASCGYPATFQTPRESTCAVPKFTRSMTSFVLQSWILAMDTHPPTSQPETGPTSTSPSSRRPKHFTYP